MIISGSRVSVSLGFGWRWLLGFGSSLLIVLFYSIQTKGIRIISLLFRSFRLIYNLRTPYRMKTKMSFG